MSLKENPFIDPQGYRDYMARMEKKYQGQLQREREAGRRPSSLPAGAPIETRGQWRIATVDVEVECRGARAGAS